MAWHRLLLSSTLLVGSFCAVAVFVASAFDKHTSEGTGRALRKIPTTAEIDVSDVQSQVAWVTERLPMASLRRSWLPTFGGDSSSSPSSTDPPDPWPADDSIPEDVASHWIVKEAPKLPYRMYDHFDLGGALGRQGERQLIALRNDVAEVLIDPKHGGKILSYKVRGKERLFRNPVFQPGMLGILGAWTSGGIEFNWPHHGHSAFGAAPVYVASFDTEDLGKVIRVYEFDRVLNSTWQVDIALVGETLAIHPRVINLNNHTIDGYWWTNIGVVLTDSTRALYNNGPSVVRNRGPRGDYLAPFPILSDDHATGLAVEGNSSLLATDHSFPRKNYQACEMFVRPGKEDSSRSLWMAAVEADGSGFAHTQPPDMTGRKYWVWGRDPADQGRMTFLSRCKVEDGQPTTKDCEGVYFEMQAGPAPTQSNFFPVEKERSWTETFLPISPDGNTHKPGQDGYNEALQVVGDVVDQETALTQRVDRALTALERLGPKELASWEVLHEGTGFGRVHELLLGHELSSSLQFASSNAEVRPWLNLVSHGRFSNEDLAVLSPSSFIVDGPYMNLLRRTEESWLQQLHLGIALRQQGDLEKATAMFQRSLSLRPSRNPLALFLLGHYEKAWRQAHDSKENPELATDIAEAWLASLVTSTGVLPALTAALTEVKAAGFDSQRIRAAHVAELVYAQKSKASCQEAIGIFLSTEWAVSDSTLTGMWSDAWYCIEDATSSTSKHASRVAHPPPRFIDFNGAT
eukprot:TRINITY_DN31585_c0_g1_i1.p1 TRINITY_DN31585_c0_g1~~TRINITY_DN31585_c0_g1_i1.p1  ORF type:complete len:745 (+),score=91.31 TRINITY_DN31585_c0_g1_i1:86-2320(+)